MTHRRVHPKKSPLKSPLKFLEKREWAYPGTAKMFWVPPIISGMGKATRGIFQDLKHGCYPTLGSPPPHLSLLYPSLLSPIPLFLEVPYQKVPWLNHGSFGMV